MAIAVDPKLVIRYVLKADRDLPTDQRTVFRFHAQTDRCEREASNLASKSEYWESGMSILRNCMEEWENFVGADGQPIPFATDRDGRPTTATLCKITEADRSELLKAIQSCGTSKLTEEDLGN